LAVPPGVSRGGDPFFGAGWVFVAAQVYPKSRHARRSAESVIPAESVQTGVL
jgi:hypothetical protein